MVIAFGGPYRFPGFCGNQHIGDSTWSQNPLLNGLGNGSRSCFVGFRCFGNTSCSFHFAFICMHLPSLSFHLHASSFHFAFISFHIPFMFIPMCIHVLSFSFHLHAFSFHSAFMSFHFISKALEIGSMAWPGDWVQHMIIAKLSLRLSLNNPSNIWHCSKEICHKNDRERERERESQRVGCQMIW